MKTNHKRGFVASRHRDQAMTGASAASTFADVCFGYWVQNDFTNGNRGMAKEKRGGKKYVRSRIRFHEKAVTKRLAVDVVAGE
jgi:hypothetical protein